VATVLTPLRLWLKKPQPYIASLMTLVIALPNLAWQKNNGWPVINHMRELAETQLVHVSIDVFIAEQFMMFLPVFIIWIFGLVYTLFLPQGQKYRAFAWIYLTVVLLLILLRGKSYYTLGLYSSLFVFGGVFMEKVLTGGWKILSYAVILLALAVSVFSIPMSLPILKPEAFISFYSKLGMEKFHRWEDGEYYDLPQDYADMIGWKNLADIVGRTWNSLTPDQQLKCSIFADNYGEAGSVNFYGTKYKLPAVICFNDSYLFWAPDSVQADILIKIGSGDELEGLYHKAEITGRLDSPHARPHGTPVYLCSDPKININSFYQEKLQQNRDRYNID
jgi:hypothetical protein